eukprot:5395991-Amphidinium_carterae.1
MRVQIGCFRFLPLMLCPVLHAWGPVWVRLQKCRVLVCVMLSSRGEWAGIVIRSRKIDQRPPVSLASWGAARHAIRHAQPV